MNNKDIAGNIIDSFGGCFIDCDNILWKRIDKKWIGKRAIQLKSNRMVWIEDVSNNEVKVKDGKINYQEVFYS